MLRALLVAVLTVPVLLGAPPARAAEPEVTVVLVLAQQAADRGRLHALAARPGRHDLRALAPRPVHRAAVDAWVRRTGADLVRDDGWTVTVRGPRAAVAGAPSALRGHVSSVLGLRPGRVHRSHATSDGIDHPMRGPALRAAYDVPDAWRGAGVTVGILNLAGWDRTDLTTYAAQEGIALAPGQVQEVPVGLDPTELDGFGSEFEVALDSEAVLATAPEARQRLYFAPNTEAGVVAALGAMADDAAAGRIQVASTSWGICERIFAEGTAGLRAAYASAIDRLVASGATLFAASGDAGAFDCATPDEPDQQAQVDFPASYVNTVGVGGTTLTPGRPQTAWYDGGFGSYLGDGSGGGQSLSQPLPAYQQGLVAGATHRLVPDVASVADPQSGLWIYVRNAGGRTVAGGTSLAAPTWAGMLAAALSGAGRTTGLGNVLPALYASDRGLVDVVDSHNGLWSAGPGYDLTTGLGVPSWQALGPALLEAAPAGLSDATSTSPTVRPAAAAEPRLRARRWVRTLDVPVTVTGGPAYSGYAVGESVPACARLTARPPATARLDLGYQGDHEIVLTALDDSLTCHVVTAVTGYDTVPPTAAVSGALLTTADTRVLLRLGGRDAVSGIGSWHVVVRELDGPVVLSTDTTASELSVHLSPGRRFTVEATARDRAGNIGRPAATTLALPLDDRALTRTGRWGRADRPASYERSHLRSADPGATIGATVTGRDATMWLLRSPAGGLADVYVDGRRTQRVNLAGPAVSLVRVRVAAWATPGRHTVVVRVVRGDVLVDALAVSP